MMVEIPSLREARDWLAEVEGCDMTPLVERAQKIIASLLAENDRLFGREQSLLPLADALEDDERHGNLTGRAEVAWEAYKYGR